MSNGIPGRTGARVGAQIGLALLVASLIILVGEDPANVEASGVTTRVSVATGGGQANGLSDRPAVSADGRYVVFEGANASNLVPGDTNGVSDMFVHDRWTQTTERISVDSAEGQSNGGSAFASMSEEARYIGYQSIATNLVAGDTNGLADVFVRDRTAGTTERVSVDASGAQINGASGLVSLSADGRYAAFMSGGAGVPVDTNGAPDVYVRDLQADATGRVSEGTGGVQGNGSSTSPAISADGRFVAFYSSSSNLAVGDTNNAVDVFVTDRQTGVTGRVSVDSAGVEGNAGSGVIGADDDRFISNDGRYVAFTSDASNLVASDTNGAKDVFVRDRQAGNTRRVSVDSAGGQANGGSFSAQISGDGRFVIFGSQGSNLVAGDTNSSADVFVHDLTTGITTRVSVSSAREQSNRASPEGDGGFEPPAISVNGRYAAFASAGTNLVSGDTNGWWDIFVHDLGDQDADGEWDTFDPPATFHCTWTPTCPEIAIVGDPPSGFPFRGYGDPSIEYDPDTGELWMSYSWLDVNVTSPGPPPVIDFGVRTHLAKSTDGGATWTFVREVNDTTLISHPDTSAPGWLIHEVSTLARRGTGDWELLWLTYFDPQGGAHGVGNSDFHYRRSVASTPDDLGDIEAAWIGGNITSPSFGATHNFNAIPQLSDCTTFTEPALLAHGSETYLATNCVVFSSGVRQPQLERLVLLREDGGGYDYIGVLLDYDDAVANGGERIEQADLAIAQNGAVLLIGTPIQATTPNHLGCTVFEVLDLNTASVRRDGSGEAVKLLQITGDDPGIGAGLCTYDAESSTGVVMVLHDQDPAPDVVFSMRATGQRPQGVDIDADGRADTADNCPAWVNPGQNLPAWSVPAGDSDCDGFPDTATSAGRGRESFIGTDAVDQCADNASDNAWPADTNNSRAVNLSDVVAFGVAFNTMGPNPPYNPRLDLNAAPQPNGAVNLSDIVTLGPFFNWTCS